MTLTELRQLVRDSARNAGDTTQYGESVIDYALLKLGIRFCRETRYLWTSSDLTLTSGSTALPTLPTGFLPRRAMGAWIASVGRVHIVSPGELIELAISDSGSGDVTRMAFTSNTAGLVWRTPASALTLKLQWWQAFTTWTRGTTASDAITVNLPDEVLYEIVPDGAAGILQQPDPEHGYASAAWKRYLELELKYKSDSGSGAGLVDRESI